MTASGIPATFILLAYGPGQVTKAAVERMLRLVHDDQRIVVVPAIVSAQRFVRRVRSPRLEVAPSPGREGLASVLGAVPASELVLLVHDDVLLPAATVEAMARERAASGSIVVPWSNDQNSDTSIGALPPVKRAVAAALASAAPSDSQQIEVLRPSCLLASASQLRRLLPKRLTVARTQLAMRDIVATAAAGAVVAHDSTCVTQMEPPDSPDQRPLVTATLIVRDEEDMIGDCLASLDGFADRVLVCDTGSTDDTMSIARAAGAEVIEREWRNDFGWARNEVLAEATDSWYILQIDADERLEVADIDEVRRELATDVHDAQGLLVTVSNIDERGVAGAAARAIRLFRPTGTAYVGALHEMPMIDGEPMSTAAIDGLRIDHYGYVRAVVDAKDKGQRNVDIARTSYEQAPTAEHALQLARSLTMVEGAERDVDIARLAQEALDAGLEPRARAHALGLVSGTHLRAGRHDDAEAAASEALSLVPLDDIAALRRAQVRFGRGDHAGVIDSFESRFAASSPEPYVSSTAARVDELLLVAQSHLALDEPEAAFSAGTKLLPYRQELTGPTWMQVVSILALHDPEAALDVLADSVRHDLSGGCIQAISQIYEPNDVADYMVGLVSDGSVAGRSVQVGMTIALVADREDLMRALAPLVRDLDPDIVDRIMQKAAQRGQQTAVSVLAQELLATG